MNKTLTISLVAALGLVGGGAYTLISTDKNFSEYVPDTVSSMLGDYLPESLKAKTISDSTVIIEEYVKETEPQIQQEEAQQEPQEEVVVIDSQTESIEKADQEIEQQVQEQNNDNAVAIAMDEIQKSINEVSPSTAIEKTPNNSNASNITKKIDEASMKISKLDIENKALEEKFQNILRKNRELAKKLQEIDKQLAH